MRKRLLTLVLTLALVLGITPVLTSDADALTEDEQIEKLISIAGQQIGQSVSYANWCGKFVWWCAEQAGLTSDGIFPAKDVMASVYEAVKWYGANVPNSYVYFFSDSAIDGGTLMSPSEYQPQKGDIVILRDYLNGGHRWSHMGIVYDVTNTAVKVYHGSWNK